MPCLQCRDLEPFCSPSACAWNSGEVHEFAQMSSCCGCCSFVPHTHRHLPPRPACFLFLISGKHATLVVGFERVTPAPVQQGDCQAFFGHRGRLRLPLKWPGRCARTDLLWHFGLARPAGMLGRARYTRLGAGGSAVVCGNDVVSEHRRRVDLPGRRILASEAVRRPLTASCRIQDAVHSHAGSLRGRAALSPRPRQHLPAARAAVCDNARGSAWHRPAVRVPLERFAPFSGGCASG